MQEELITFKTAKLAKEKGFDILNSLIGSNHSFYKSDGSKIVGDSFAKQLLHHAPTQALLQRWLREKYNLLVTVEFKSTHGFSFLVQESYYKNWPLGTPSHFIDLDEPIESKEVFDTYELAFEKGLFKALKQIK